MKKVDESYEAASANLRGRIPIRILSVLAAALALASCNGTSLPNSGSDADLENDSATDNDAGEGREYVPASTIVMFDPGRRGHLFDAPFPNNDRLHNGRADFSGYPNTDPPNSVLEEYIALANQVLDGFGCNSPVYFRFSGAIDTSTLPADELAALSSDSSAYMVNVDEQSPDYGEFVPMGWEYIDKDRTFRPAHTVAIKPMWGFALRPSTTYAVIITSDVRDAAGEPVGPDESFWRLLNDQGIDDELKPFKKAITPLLKWAASKEIDTTKFAAAAVFTTQDSVGELFRMRDYVFEELAAPDLLDVHLESETSKYYVYEGLWKGTNFQHGKPPYSTSGGGFEFDENGKPVPYTEEELRFSFVVPKAEQPLTGWPVVIYGHGTGGSYRSVYSSGGKPPAELLAEKGIASFGIDQPIHGPRAPEGTNVDMWTFNFINPISGRTLFRQSALDSIEALRFVRESLVVPASVSKTGEEVRPDIEKVMYMGHSQGGMSGALIAAVEPSFKGFVLSGAAGGLAITILERKDPIDLEETLRFFLAIPDDEDLTTYHPVLALIQTLVDVTDMINYAPFWHHIEDMGRPRNLLMTQGFLDEQSPRRASDALVVAGRLPILEPVGWAIQGLDVLGIDPVSRPASGNVHGSMGGIGTEAVSQYPRGDHWTIFHDEDAQSLYSGFLESLLTNDLGVLE